MKIRDLTRTHGSAVFHVWPPGVIASAGAILRAGVGNVKSLRVDGQRIFIIIQDGDLEGTATLEWDAPPSVHDVETVLRANLGASLKSIGELDVPSAAR
jgi:hypothetical protein